MTLMFVALFALGTGQAAAECKGSAKSACSSSKSCSWVSGYTKKDGNKVKGHCRSKSKSGNSSSNKKDIKSKDKKSKDKKSKDKKSKNKKSKSKKSKDKKSKSKKSKDKKSKDKKSKNNKK